MTNLAMNQAAALGYHMMNPGRKVRAPQGMMPGNTRAWPLNRSGQKVQQKAYSLTK